MNSDLERLLSWHDHRHPGRRILTVLTLLGTLLGGSAAFAEKPEETVNRLEKRRAQVRTLRHFTRSEIRGKDPTYLTIIRSWEARQSKDTRKWFVERKSATRGLDPGSKWTFTGSTVTVCDGVHEWREVPSGGEKMIVKGKPTPLDDFRELRGLMARGHTRIEEGEETVSGHPCIVVAVVGDKDDDRFRATFWIAERYGIVLKRVVTSSDGIEKELRTLEIDVNEPISAATFVFQERDGVRIIDTEAMKKPE